jgi:hypothetical protein
MPDLSNRGKLNTGTIWRVKIEKPLPNTYWVIPNRLLAGEYPGCADEPEAERRLGLFHDAGIGRFIDLTEEGELPSYHHLLADPGDHFRSAVTDCSVPYNVSQTRDVLDNIRNSLAGGHNLYVHCRAGIGRTGLMIGCLLAEDLDSGKAALKQLNVLWKQSERNAARANPRAPFQSRGW